MQGPGLSTLCSCIIFARKGVSVKKFSWDDSLYLQARVVAKRKTLWGRVKSSSQGVLPKETQRQLAGAIKQRPWLAPATVMATLTLICALVWVFVTYGS